MCKVAKILRYIQTMKFCKTNSGDIYALKGSYMANLNLFLRLVNQPRKNSTKIKTVHKTVEIFSFKYLDIEME